MANNLSQLASNVLFSAKAAGGFGAALGQIGKAMLGPLGVLLAIQTGIALLERWSMTSGKAEKATEELSESTAIAASNFKILLQAQRDNTLSTSEASKSVRKINSEYKDLNVQIDENGKLTDESVVAIERKISALEDLAKAQAIQNLIEEEYSKIALANIELDELNLNLANERARAAELSAEAAVAFESVSASAQDAAINRYNAASRAANSASSAVRQTVSEIENIQKTISNLVKQIPDISDLFEVKKRRSGSGRANKRFRAQVLNLQKFILNNQRREAMMLEENEVEKLKIKQKYEREDLVRRRTEFRDKQQKRLDDFLASSKSRKRNAEAKEKFNKSQIQADGEFFQALSALGIKHTAENHVQMLELERKFAEELVNQRLTQISASESMLQSFTAGTEAGSLNRPMSAVGAESIDRQNEMARQRMDAEQANFEDDLERKKKNLLDEGFELLQVEQMIQGERHAFQMNQVQQEIELERNKIEAKKNINQEYISWLGGLGGILKNIAGENEALATAALVLEKGAAIANIVVETQAANAGILVNTGKEAGAAAAAGAAAIAKGGIMLSGGNPAGAGLISAGKAGIASAAGIKSGGVARVNKNKIAAGISIASILSTSLGSQGSVGSSGGGGGGESGAGGRSFDFNLVGSTGVNQLAEGIGGQFTQPLQAYVVSSQMTSQQQLDNVIQSSATIGD